jgi:putative endonuclease
MRKKGDLGEEIAVGYLKGKGYEILERNWRGKKNYKSPEIDIIAQNDDTLVFIEVKTSSSTKFGDPREWITLQKCRRIAKGASSYLAFTNQTDIDCRFDAIAIDRLTRPPKIIHIENAFLLSDLE